MKKLKTTEDGLKALAESGRYENPFNHERFRPSIRDDANLSNIFELGLYGNIWVRSHVFEKAGDTNGGGHYHHFDHVTLLAVGSVLVEVDGYEPKEFHAPTFIVIDKDHKHKFTALTDKVVYYCVYAVLDEEFKNENIFSLKNKPFMTKDDYDFEIEQKKKQRLKELEQKTTHEDDV